MNKTQKIIIAVEAVIAVLCILAIIYLHAYN